MSFLDKILGQQPKTLHPVIRILGSVPADKLTEVERVIKAYYTGSNSNTKVIEEIKKVTGLKVGRISLEYSKRKNVLTVYYCC